MDVLRLSPASSSSTTSGFRAVGASALPRGGLPVPLHPPPKMWAAAAARLRHVPLSHKGTADQPPEPDDPPPDVGKIFSDHMTMFGKDYAAALRALRGFKPDNMDTQRSQRTFVETLAKFKKDYDVVTHAFHGLNRISCSLKREPKLSTTGGR